MAAYTDGTVEVNTLYESASSSTSVFPTEIYEHIITFISEDTLDGRWRGNLCRCALVSRPWLHWSQRCLYSVLDFREEPHGIQFNRVAIVVRSIRDNPGVGQYVREMFLIVGPHDISHRIWPVMLAGRLQNLRVLGLMGGGLQCSAFDPHKACLASLTISRAITKLRLTEMNFSYCRFLHVLSCLLSLEDLSIHKLSWSDLYQRSRSESLPEHHPSLRTLRMLDRAGLLYDFDCGYTAEYARRLFAIISTFRMTMHVMSLDAFSLYDLYTAAQDLAGTSESVVHFPQLSCLTLGYDVIRYNGEPASPVGLLNFLRRLDMPLISTIKFVVHIKHKFLEHAVGEWELARPFTDPSLELAVYAERFASLQSMDVLYLVYRSTEDQHEATPMNDSSVSAAEGGQKLSAVHGYVDESILRFRTSALYRRGVLTIRGAYLQWRREFKPPRIDVTQWKYHGSTEAPSVSSLHGLKYDDDLAEYLLQL